MKKQELYNKGIEWAENGCPLPKVGDFVIGFSSGMKCDHGKLLEELKDRLQYNEYDEVLRVVAAVTVEDVFTANWDEVIKVNNLQGTGGSDDDDTPGEYITRVFVAVDEQGRFIFVDTEGYSYARYMFTPPLDVEEFCPDAVREIEHERAEEAEKEERERAEREQEYKSTCEPWEGVLTPWNGEKDTALIRLRISNIKRMLKAKFPGVKFSVTTGYYKSEYTVRWDDGPSEYLVRNSVPLHILVNRRWRDDYGDHETEFTEFSVKYMGDGESIQPIELNRKVSNETYDSVTAEVNAKIQELGGLEQAAMWYKVNEFKDCKDFRSWYNEAYELVCMVASYRDYEN
jgi:hypothetical protein